MPPLIVMRRPRARPVLRDPANASQDPGLEKRRDQNGIELRAAPLGQYVHGIVEPVCATVAPTVGDRIEGVGNRDDTRLNGNVLGDEPTRIAGSIPAFVMRQHAFGQVRVKEGQGMQDVGATLWVGHDEAALLRSHLAAVIVHDVEERFVDFTDVVKERNALDAANRRLIEVGRTSERHTVGGDATHVCASDGVVGVDGVEQRLERGGGEARGALRPLVLANEESANAGAEGEKDRLSHGAERGKNRTEHV